MKLIRRSAGLFSVGLSLLLMATAPGCHGPTPEDRDNRRALDVILTAITLKNARLLEASAERAKIRHDAGQFTDEEYEQIEAFLAKARGGDWSGAEQDGYAFRRGHPFVAAGH